MPVKLEPINLIIADLGLQKDGPAMSHFTQTCVNHMDKFIPLGDTGNLRSVKTMTTDSVTYKSPYAHYQYKGEREDGTHKVKTYTTPGTGPYWDKRMWSVDGKKIIKEMQGKYGK